MIATAIAAICRHDREEETAGVGRDAGRVDLLVTAKIQLIGFDVLEFRNRSLRANHRLTVK
jgi:hypothetical protein